MVKLASGTFRTTYPITFDFFVGNAGTLVKHKRYNFMSVFFVM